MGLLKNNKKYDLDTLEGINSIPIPKYKPISGIQSPTNNIEYILQRKATEHKKNGRMDLAIACLRKANEIMPYSNFKWQAKDYMRLIKYLKLNGQHEEAEKEMRNLELNHPELFDMRINNKKRLKDVIEKARSCGQDLLMISVDRTCPICGSYNKKFFFN